MDKNKKEYVFSTGKIENGFRLRVEKVREEIRKNIGFGVKISNAHILRYLLDINENLERMSDENQRTD